MNEELLLGRVLVAVEKLDVGDAKKTRIKGFVRSSFAKNKQHDIDLKKLCSMSRSEIVREKYKL